MTDQAVARIWEQILQVLEEKLQYGIVEQARSVVDLKLEGTELTLYVATDEALDYFSAHVNQQRLIILSRGVVSLDKVLVERRTANPI